MLGSANVRLQHVSVRADTYGDAMPQWILFLVLAIVAWLALAVGGGLLVGRLIVAARAPLAASAPTLG